MANSLRLYLAYAGTSLRAQMQYRASFVVFALSHFLVTGVEFLGIWALFDRFGSLQEWSLAEVALFYGMVSVAFATAEAVARGFDTFPGMVRSGEFDRVLLRPRTAALQIMGRELQLMRIGRFSQGVIVLLWAAGALEVAWTLPRIALAFGAVAGGACLFSGIFVLQATMAFWTVETLEVVNTVTYGGVEAAQFPLTIYKPWFRRFFTFVVPLATINYFPAHAILGRTDPLGTPALFHWCAPAIGAIFLLVCLQAWRFGVRHYRSTGS
ncbi:MAG: ABC transporter permease [Planctomycetota bacterium]|jgi:ABC-2 type transport system permease protein